jgi:enoyl-CoA hydratase/carnithine racemase
MAEEPVLFDTDGRVGVITLNRPERLNAITGRMLAELSEVLLRCDRDHEVRAVVLTGAGRGFCSGLDLQDVAAGTSDITGGSSPNINEHPPFVLRRIDVPVVCALNGPASGYGMDLALGCDLVLASDRARFVSPVRRSLVPESGGTWLLPRLIGWHKACEVVLLARTLDAAEIERLGLANAVVPHDELAAEAMRWAQELAANPPLAVAAAKRTMRSGLDSTFEANGHHVMSELVQLMHTDDFREGVQSFVEKRPPEYEGR